MSISHTLTADGSELVIAIKGRFDFTSHQEFRSAYESLDRMPSRYCIDMRDTTYLDSSALGMLLLLRDHAGGDNANIKIANCGPDVKKILSISNFEKLFNIE